MRHIVALLLVAAAVTVGQEAYRFELKDGTVVTGRVIDGNPRMIVVATDSGRVEIIRSGVAQATALPEEAAEADSTVSPSKRRELGYAAGVRAADDSPNAWWVAGTCVAGSGCWPVAAPIALSLAWKSKATVPSRLVAGLSGEYAAGFSDGYARRATQKQRLQTVCGVVGSGVVFAVVVLAIQNSMEHMFDGFHIDL